MSAESFEVSVFAFCNKRGSPNSPSTVDSKKLEYRPKTIYAAFSSSLGLRVGGQSYSDFLASTVGVMYTL